MLTRHEKEASVALTQNNEKDTGSSAVQLSLLTKRIKKLSDHLKGNHKDKHSRRGLVNLVEQRRKHISYLKRKNATLFETTAKKLGLRQ